MGIMFPRLGKIVPHAKLYSLTNGKYIPTTGKNNLYRQKNVFSLVEIMYPQLG